MLAMVLPLMVPGNILQGNSCSRRAATLLTILLVNDPQLVPAFWLSGFTETSRPVDRKCPDAAPEPAPVRYPESGFRRWSRSRHIASEYFTGDIDGAPSPLIQKGAKVAFVEELLLFWIRFTPPLYPSG